MKTVFNQLAAWWRRVRASQAGAVSAKRYVRKPKIVGRTSYATRAVATAGRHALGVPVSTLRRRLAAERMLRSAAYHLAARHGRRRAPSGVVVMLRRAHRAGTREKSPARSRRLGDLTGQIPRRVHYHGRRVKLTLLRSVRDGAWVVA